MEETMRKEVQDAPVVRLKELRAYLDKFPEDSIVVLGEGDIGRNGEGAYVSLAVAMTHLEDELSRTTSTGVNR
jgi:hypothetical protein